MVLFSCNTQNGQISGDMKPSSEYPGFPGQGIGEGLLNGMGFVLELDIGDSLHNLVPTQLKRVNLMVHDLQLNKMKKKKNQKTKTKGKQVGTVG